VSNDAGHRHDSPATLNNITVEQALRIILGVMRPVGTEAVPVAKALGRVLAADIRAGADHPPRDNSAMDGYGLDGAGSPALPARLRIAGTVFAGGSHHVAPGPGEAVKIMTGAPIPRGVDRVVPFEEASERDGHALITRLPAQGMHIRRQGEDFKKGEILISKGRTVRPAETAVLAALGKTMVKVFRRPRVAVLATGDELVPAGKPLGRGKIRDSNSPALAASVLACGAEPVILGIGRDSVADLKRKMIRGLASDALIVAGGVSAGEADYGRDALHAIGGRLVFFKVRQRPGHPLAFGRAKGRPVFILPGNPVSAMLTFHIYVRPALLAMGGARDAAPMPVPAELGEEIRGKAGRTEFLRVRLQERDGRTLAFLTGPQGSGILTSMVRADGYIVLPEEADRLPQGTILPVHPL